MDTHSLDQWIEVRRRRPLLPHEEQDLQVCLALDPALRSRWEEELTLDRLLRDLPDTPVPSNFNATVWAAAQRQTVPARSLAWTLAWFRLPRPAMGVATAACALVLLLGALSYTHYQSFDRARMAASLADISRGVEITAAGAQLPPAEILQDFEAIYRLSQVRSLADEELLAALQ
jgi:anti-sigma factor RsiW